MLGLMLTLHLFLVLLASFAGLGFTWMVGSLLVPLLLPGV